MINKVIIVGYVGKDAEIRYTPSGSSVANFSVATTEKWSKNGEKTEKTEWHKIVAFGKLAEICGEYLTKGKLIYIEGKLQTRNWEDKDGIKRYSTEIVANVMKMLGGKTSSNSGTGAGSSSSSRNTYPEPDLDDVPF